MKIVKFAKAAFAVITLSIFLAAGLLCGIQMEQNRLKQEEQLETVEEIAVVNLDEGIYTDRGKLNYASELMEFPGEHFVATSLEAARTGIYDGSFAAYIIIPAGFSANAESINSIPQKSVIEYAVNPNLKAQVSNRVIADINNFESTISRNIEEEKIAVGMKLITEESFAKLMEEIDAMQNVEQKKIDEVIVIIRQEMESIYLYMMVMEN